MLGVRCCFFPPLRAHLPSTLHAPPPAHRVPRAGTRLPGAPQLRSTLGALQGEKKKGQKGPGPTQSALSTQQIPKSPGAKRPPPAPPGSHSPRLGEESGGQPKKGLGGAGSGVANLLRLYFNPVNYAEPCSFRAQTAGALSGICGDPAPCPRCSLLSTPRINKRSQGFALRVHGVRHGPLLGKKPYWKLDGGFRIHESAPKLKNKTALPSPCQAWDSASATPVRPPGSRTPFGVFCKQQQGDKHLSLIHI